MTLHKIHKKKWWDYGHAVHIYKNCEFICRTYARMYFYTYTGYKTFYTYSIKYFNTYTGHMYTYTRK